MRGSGPAGSGNPASSKSAPAKAGSKGLGGSAASSAQWPCGIQLSVTRARPWYLAWTRSSRFDRVADGASHADVCELGRVGLKAEVERRNARGTPRLESLVVLEQGKQQGRNRGDGQVALPGKHAQRPCVVVADHDHAHVRIDRRSAVPVGVVAKLQNPRRPGDQAVRAGSDGQGLFWGGDSPEGIFASDDRELEVREKRGVWLTEDEQDGPRVGDLHLGDPSVVLGVAAL